MLVLKELCAGYGKKEIIKGIEAEFQRGIVYAILGPNGSGKSTLLRTIDRVIRPHRGKIFIDGEALDNLSARDTARKIAYLPQRSNSTPFSNVFDTVLLGRKPHISFEPTERDLDIVEGLIEYLGLYDFAFRKVGELSGGEAQKVLIARALAQQPEVLLLDEPVNHLDPKNQIEILRILRELTQKFDIITIIVLHDLNLALQFADYFIFMKNGKIYKSGTSNIIEKSLIKKIYDIDIEIIAYNGKKYVITP